MIKNNGTFEICPDKYEAQNGCEFCNYFRIKNYDAICTIFEVLGEKRLAYNCNFCPLTGQLGPDWIETDTPKIYAVLDDCTMHEIKSIDEIRQKGLFNHEARCTFKDKTSVWVRFNQIKNGEEKIQ